MLIFHLGIFKRAVVGSDKKRGATMLHIVHKDFSIVLRTYHRCSEAPFFITNLKPD